MGSTVSFSLNYSDYNEYFWIFRLNEISTKLDEVDFFIAEREGNVEYKVDFVI